MSSTSRRPPLTIAVLPGSDKAGSKTFVTNLAPALAPGDNLVLLGHGNHPGSPSSWRERRGRPELVRPTTTPTVRELVVVIDDRVLWSDGFLEALATAAVRASLGAVGARTNVADGDELLLGIGYRPGNLAARRAYLRSFGSRRPGATTAASHLGGPCVLVRRDHLEAGGGLEALARSRDVAKLSALARSAGQGLAVAEDAYVHHPGGPTLRPGHHRLPLVSACLIVRDEEHQLSACLTSAQGLADEIVVYDTGSNDGTVALARELGARVIEGHWDDDFARARNDALAECSGQWILWLDADEVLECEDRPGLRSFLEASSSDVEGYLVLIDNFQGTEAATMLTHPAARLFRRACARWEGRLHEQVVPRQGGGETAVALLGPARITHRGYLQGALGSRDKAARNLRTAFGDLAGGSELDRGTRVLSLGRSYMLSRRYEEGLELCRQAVALSSHPTPLRLGLRAISEGLLALDRPDEALEAIAELRRLSRVPALADLLEGRARLALGEPTGALAAFDRVGNVIDDDGFEYRPTVVATGRAEALTALGRDGEAADALLGSLREAGGLDSHLGLLVEALERANRSPVEIYDALDPTRILAFVPQILQLQSPAADRILDAWADRDPSSRPILAAAAQVAPRLSIPRQLLWSARLRRTGVSASCPLVAAATALDLPARDRVLSTAVATVSFGDNRALLAFGASVASLDRAERQAVRAELTLVAPGLLHRFDALEPPTPAPRATAVAVAPTAVAPTGVVGRERSTSAAKRRVLVLSRIVSSLASNALCVAIARQGHDVTLAHPQPARPSQDLLAPHGVAVRGWTEFDRDKGWKQACLSSVARLYASQTIDTVVLANGTTELREALADLLPVAEILSSPSWRGPTIPPLTDLVGIQPATALGARMGVCIATDLRGADPGRLALVTGTLLPALRSAPFDASFSHCGDDPDLEIRRVLPEVVDAGPLADPSAWLRSARAVVVIATPAAADDDERWLELARTCGTPGVVVRSPGDVDGAVSSLLALLDDDETWHASFADRSPVSDPTTAFDPFADLARPWSRTNQVGRSRPRGSGRPRVCLASPVFSLDSLAQVNRELARCLSDAALGFDLFVATPESLEVGGLRRTLPGVEVHALQAAPAASLEIRHQWPPDFRPARGGRLICMQPFEYGGLPSEWIGPLRDVVDELWVPTSWVRECAIQSGVAQEKVHVVPNGVDVARFRPDGISYPLRTTRTTKFLFVGGCIDRKGIDALLEAYLGTFTADDDVCLVVKPYGSSTVYRTSSLEADVRRAAGGNGAEIEIVDEVLGIEEMAGLYRACDALVHPYRGEGFGLPIAEAMATGLPVIVTDGGACLDFCDDEVAWLVPARKVIIAASGWTPTEAGTWWLEPSRAALGAAMRAVVDDPELAKRRGAAGRDRIVARFTWQVAADRAAERIEAVLSSTTAPPPAARRALELAGPTRGGL